MSLETEFAQVVVVNGPLAGSAVDVGDALTVGRRPENKLRLSDEAVSRYHAKIEREGDAYVVEDLGSSSGTLVDGRSLNGRAPLREGSRIVIGQTTLKFTRSPSGITDGNLQVMRFSSPVERSGAVTLVPVDAPFKSKDPSSSALTRAGAHLETLLSANTIISTELDLERLFDKIINQIFQVLPGHRAVVMTHEDGENRVRAARGRDGRPVKDQRVSQTIVGQAIRERAGVMTLDAGADQRFELGKSIVDQDIRSVLCAPMVHQETVLGVIYVDTVGISTPFTEDDLRLLAAIAGAAGGAVKNALLHSRLKVTAVDTIVRLATAAEYRDDDTGFHIHRMSDYAEALARALGHPDGFCETLKYASPMHDVGKIGIADAILKKPGKLTPEEFDEMKTHTVKGAAILSNSDSELLQMAERIALTHHEKYSGAGYPKGLAGEDIPVEGRIVAVADVFDALTSKRCYKPAFSLSDSLKTLKEGAGGHFDPKIIECFFDIQERILAIRDHYLALEQVQKGKAPSPHQGLLKRAQSRRA